MDELFLLQLGVKMALSAGIVVAASIVTERAGPLIGATIAMFPWASGPAYVFLAMDHDAAFIARSALVSLVVFAPNLVFAMTYTAFARRRSALVSVAAAGAVWLATTLILLQAHWTLATVLLLDFLVYAVCLWIARFHRTGRIMAVDRARWWELPLRGLAIAGLVGVVIVVGRELGPTAAGIASMTPVVLISLAFVLHRRLGGRASATVMANTLPGMLGFLFWLVTLHLVVVPLGLAVGLALAILVGCGWNLLFLQVSGAWTMRAGGNGPAFPRSPP